MNQSSSEIKVEFLNMQNKDLVPDFEETIPLEQIIIPEGLQVDLGILLQCRLRVPGFGNILINHKNELIYGVEGLVLAIERGENLVNIKRSKPVLLKFRK
jgi:hypothetical protein